MGLKSGVGSLVAALLLVASSASAQPAPQTSPSGPLVSHVIVDSCSGCGGGASGTIGAAVPATATPIGVKDNAGNLAYPLLDASGNLLVAVTGAGSGGTSSVDGAAYTAGASAGTAVIGARDDAAVATVAEDKLGIARITTFRALHVNLRDVAGVEAFVPGTGPTHLGKAEGAAYAAGTTGVMALGVVNETIGVSALEGQYVPLATDQFGHLSITGSVSTIDAFGNSPIHRVDDAFVAAQSGAAAVAVRKAAPVNLSGSDGDYEMLQMSAGRLWVDPSGVTLTVGSHAVTNTGVFAVQGDLTKLAGTATSVNSGTKDAGTLRVVIATDQPALTNKLLVTPDSVALPANQSVNTAQFGGTNVSTGTGASGVGIPRVTVANDSNVLATQSGTWTVQPGNTANTTAWKVDGSAVTQPVSGAVTVSGTVTANAGTNLNTSLLALEAGGNLATVKTNTDKLDIALSALRDALTGVSARTLTDAYTQLATIITTLTNQQALPGATTTPARLDGVGGQTNDATPQMQPLPLTSGGGAVRVLATATRGLPLPPCNAVRQTTCQPKGY